MTNELFNFSDWLEGIETPAEGVTVYQKPGLIARLAKLEETVEALPPDAERSVGDRDPRAEVQALRREIAASKTVWYVSPLTREDEKAVEEAYPEPEVPVTFDEPAPRLADRATEEQSKAFLAAWAAFQEQHRAWEVAHSAELNEYKQKLQDIALLRGCARIALAVTYIETFDEKGIPTRRKVRLSGEDIRQAENKLGPAQMGLIVDALNRVATEVQEPDPFESPTS